MVENLSSWSGRGELEERERERERQRERDESVLDSEIRERKLSKYKSFIFDRDNSAM